MNIDIFSKTNRKRNRCRFFSCCLLSRFVKSIGIHFRAHYFFLKKKNKTKVVVLLFLSRL